MLRHIIATLITPAVVIMFVMAAAAQMPETLPSPFNKVEFFNWTWEWARKTLHAFMNMRHPEPRP